MPVSKKIFVFIPVFMDKNLYICQFGYIIMALVLIY